MKRVLAFDTETTSKYPDRAEVVELAAVLDDGEGRERSSVDLIVRPDGYRIPDEVAAIQGVSHDLALEAGVPHAVAASIFKALCDQADIFAAQNFLYDLLVIEGLYRRVGRPHRLPPESARFCTAVHAAPGLEIPPIERMKAAGRYNFKTPTLAECVVFLFGDELEGAHNALVDTRACGRVYFELIRRREQREEQEAAEKAQRAEERAARREAKQASAL